MYRATITYLKDKTKHSTPDNVLSEKTLPDESRRELALFEAARYMMDNDKIDCDAILIVVETTALNDTVERVP